MIKTIKEKSCPCGKTFLQYNSFQKECSIECKIKYAKKPPESKKKRKRIPKISKKHSENIRKYSRIRTIFLSRPENKFCPVTGHRATEIHHKMGKIGFADDWAREFNVPLLIDERYFLAVSRIGHQKIELNPEWAKENNYSENRIK